MTVREAMRRTREAFSARHIEDASLEAEILLRHILKMGRAQLYTEPEKELTLQQIQTYQSLVERRLSGEPSAYITGHREFYSLDFYVDRRVLIPRPESELLIDKAIEFAHKQADVPRPLIADVGTGSGALAICLAIHLPEATVFAIDISRAALEVAAINCQRHKVERRVHLLQGNLLEPLSESMDIIVANLPYVATKETAHLSPEVRDFEPKVALFSGEQGLNLMAELLAQAPAKLRKEGALFMELGEGQERAALALARKHFPGAEAKLWPDLRSIDRVLALTLSR